MKLTRQGRVLCHIIKKWQVIVSYNYISMTGHCITQSKIYKIMILIWKKILFEQFSPNLAMCIFRGSSHPQSPTLLAPLNSVVIPESRSLLVLVFEGWCSPQWRWGRRGLPGLHRWGGAQLGVDVWTRGVQSVVGPLPQGRADRWIHGRRTERVPGSVPVISTSRTCKTQTGPHQNPVSRTLRTQSVQLLQQLVLVPWASWWSFFYSTEGVSDWSCDRSAGVFIKYGRAQI